MRVLLPALLLAPALAHAQRAVPCDPDNAGLTLPPGFCATVFADRIGSARHVVVAANGDVLVNARPVNTGAEQGSGSGPGGGIMLLRDSNGDGKADLVKKVGDAAGTGIQVANGFLYATDRLSIVRYRYAAGDTVLGGKEVVVGDFPGGGHTPYNFVVDGATLYVNVGSRSNSCQERERQNNSKGVDPCVELETRAGIWTFDANKTGQTAKDGVRYATGIRNGVALTQHPKSKALWVAQHGRDQLAQNWGMTNEYSAENPGEELFEVKRGDDFGWPYCYWSRELDKKVLAPEYGGDQKTVGRCADKKNPVATFGGHWAPNGIHFYSGKQFPSRYRDGVFIVFHGSWNRAPLVQDGFRVTFQPLKGNKASGASETFADGFAAEQFKGMARSAPQAGSAVRLHRPTGIAEGRDGSLYVTDDVGGTVYRISYRGK